MIIRAQLRQKDVSYALAGEEKPDCAVPAENGGEAERRQDTLNLSGKIKRFREVHG